MLQPTQLNRWSQVTIYAKPSTYSIGLALGGVGTPANTCKAACLNPAIGEQNSCR